MPYRGKSCIPAYQNYIPCGNPKCKDSCTSCYLDCIICHKVFHYKCAGLTKKAYLEIINKRKHFICKDTCFKLLFPFHGIGPIDFWTTQFDSNVRPCKKCKKMPGEETHEMLTRMPGELQQLSSYISFTSHQKATRKNNCRPTDQFLNSHNILSPHQFGFR